MNPYDKIVDELNERAKKILMMVDCPICGHYRIQRHERVCSQCVEKLKDFAITAGMRFDNEVA